jgi:hypothetical protein
MKNSFSKTATFLLFLFVSFLNVLAQDTMYIHRNVGGILKVPVSTIDSVIFYKSNAGSSSSNNNSLSVVKSLADEYLFAHESYSDYNLTTPATEGGPVLAIKSKSNTLFGGSFKFIGDKDATFGVNKCPSQPNGGYPLYHASDGGFVHLYNGLNVGYYMANQLSPDKAAVGEFYYVCRLYLSTNYEAIMSGFGAPELKVIGSNTQLQFSNGDYKTGNQAFSAVVERMQTVIFRFVYSNNQVSIYITDKLGDNRLLSTLNIDPQSLFRYFGIGTSSHPMTHDFMAYVMKFGSTFTPTQSAQIIQDLKARYPIGTRPNKPMVYPTITYNGTDFLVNLNYVPSSTGAAMDASKTTIRWYLYDKVNAPSGNGIDKQSIIKTNNGAVLTLKRADYASMFPTTGTKNEIAIDVTCVDANGDSFVVPLTSEPFGSYY